MSSADDAGLSDLPSLWAMIEKIDAAAAMRIAGGDRVVHINCKGKTAIALEIEPLSDGSTLVRAKPYNSRVLEPIDRILSEFPDAVALFDSEDRLRFYNDAYATSVAAYLDGGFEIGISFKDLVERCAEGGLYGELMDLDGFVASRMADHQKARSARLQQGTRGRWIRVQEQRTHDGGILLVHTDVSDHVTREQRLEESEARFRSLTEHSILGMILHRDMRPLYVNAAYANLLGYGAAGEILDLPSMEALFMPQEIPRMRAILASRERGEAVPVVYEYQARRADGSPVWVQNSVSQVPWDGEPAILSTVIDITDHKEAEQAREITEQRLYDFMASSADWFFELDADLRYVFLSGRFSDATGLRQDQFLSSTRRELFAAGDLRAYGEDPKVLIRRHLADLDAHLPIRNFLQSREFPSGRRIVVSLSGDPYFDEDGDFAGYRCSAREVTAQVHTEQALRSSEARLSGILQIAPEAVIVVDQDQSIRMFNEGAENTFGYAVEEILGKPLDTLIPERFRDAHDSLFKEFADAPETSRRMGNRSEVAALRKDGTEFPAAASIAKLQDGDHTIFTVLLHDISQRKKVEVQLLTATREAELANRAKTEFLANMSHELRTPLNAIIGFAEIIEREILGPISEPKYQEYAGDILSGGQHLLEIVNDILDLAKIESGTTSLSETRVDVRQIIRTCGRLVQDRATAAGLSINFQTPNDLPNLWVDERNMKQILINLLSNAVKFTPSGGQLEIGARSVEDTGCVEIYVSDTGIGMSRENITKAMTLFGQIDGRLARKYDGTGLGLPLVQALCDAHGAELKLISAEDDGTTASVIFPHTRVLPDIVR